MVNGLCLVFERFDFKAVVLILVKAVAIMFCMAVWSIILYFGGSMLVFRCCDFMSFMQQPAGIDAAGLVISHHRCVDLSQFHW